MKITHEKFVQQAFELAQENLKDGVTQEQFRDELDYQEKSLQEVNELYDLNLKSLEDYEYDPEHFSEGTWMVVDDTFYRYDYSNELVDYEKN